MATSYTLQFNTGCQENWPTVKRDALLIQEECMGVVETADPDGFFIPTVHIEFDEAGCTITFTIQCMRFEPKYYSPTKLIGYIKGQTTKYAGNLSHELVQYIQDILPEMREEIERLTKVVDDIPSD